MLTLLLILIIIACTLLVIIILAQNPKGGGLSNIGAGASQFLGARQTADFLEKSTWYFGIGILVVVMFTYFLTSTPADATRGNKSRLENTDYSMPASPKKNAAKTPASGPAQNGQAPAGNGQPAPPAGGNQPPVPPVVPPGTAPTTPPPPAGSGH